MSDPTGQAGDSSVDVAEMMKKQAEEINKLKSQVEGAEKLLQKWGNEQGTSRKAVQDAVENIKGIVEKIPVDKIKELEEHIKNFKDEKGKQTEVSTDDIEKELSDEQREVVDKVFQGLDETKRITIANSPEEKRKFLLAFKEANPVVPNSLFQKKSVASPTQDNEWRKMFGLADKTASFIPSAKTTASKGYAGQVQTPVTKQLVNGIIPRPQGVSK